MGPKVSIILPTYNGEKYIRESIESVIKQTYTQWELIIVNDCSTDETGTIIEEYIRKDKRISVICNVHNQRLPKSLNIGFRQAKGEYLTWTSDDNLYMPKAIECMIDVMTKKQNKAMVRANMVIIDEQGKDIKNSEPFFIDEICYCNHIGACFLYKKEALDKVGGYNPDLFCVEDYDYWLRIYKEYGDIFNIQEILYKYRVHEESLSESKKQLVDKQRLKLRIMHLDFLLEKLKTNKDLITRLFFEIYTSEIPTNEVRERFVEVVPELAGYIYEISGYEFIIFGAGNYGRQLLQVLEGKVVCFADNNDKLYGSCIQNIDICSIKEAYSKYPNAVFVVTGKLDKMHSMINSLWKHGIEKYSISRRWIGGY